MTGFLALHLKNNKFRNLILQKIKGLHGLKSLIYLLLLFSAQLKSSGIKEGFKALEIYDYFKAKKIFTKVYYKSRDAYSAYGLAQIYSRNDNPFTHADSAAKYINHSYNVWHLSRFRQPFSFYGVDGTSIKSLADSISVKQFKIVQKQNTVHAFNWFLLNHYNGNEYCLQKAVYLRDELEYNQILELNYSDSTREFILGHPQSQFLAEARVLLDREVYDENTRNNLPEEYIGFIRKNPGSIMINTAYDKLFNIYRDESNTNGLAYFVKNYPKAPQNLEAWKLLFSLSVKAFSFTELKKFLEEYPQFPLKNSILKELELNKQILYPCQQGDLTGYIDNRGKFIIEATYDSASDFYEGLALVTRSDSTFFINKENQNTFGKLFQEAYVFRNGIAPVKQNGKWFFLNRQGQALPGLYDEINELSDGLYVVNQAGKYGAIDQFGQVIIEPKFDKLGDFKNSYAYFVENGVYGFVSKNGIVGKAEFDWISDFNPEEIAVVKINNKYGLINATGKKILNPIYDLVQKSGPSYFIVVQNNLYGFFSSQGCFVSMIQYEYSREKGPEYYTDGRWFKLIKKERQALINQNGHLMVDFDDFDEVNFMKDGLMLVKRKKKYGYIDSKGNIIIPCKYEQAEDFKDTVAIVFVKGKFKMLNTAGKEIYSSGVKPEKISKHYYIVGDESKTIINHWGEIVFKEVTQVQALKSELLLITLMNGETKLLND